MSRRMGVFALLMVATLVALALPLPFGAAALAFALGAVVVGIRAMAAARRAGARSAMVLLGVAVGFSTLLVVNVVTMLVLWDLQVAQQECLGRALTTSAREACAAEFQQGLDRRLDELRSRAGR